MMKYLLLVLMFFIVSCEAVGVKSKHTYQILVCFDNDGHNLEARNFEYAPGAMDDLWGLPTQDLLNYLSLTGWRKITADNIFDDDEFGCIFFKTMNKNQAKSMGFSTDVFN